MTVSLNDETSIGLSFPQQQLSNPSTETIQQPFREEEEKKDEKEKIKPTKKSKNENQQKHEKPLFPSFFSKRKLQPNETKKKVHVEGGG